MKKFFFFAAALVASVSVNAQFFQFSHEGLNADAVTAIPAGTALGSNDALVATTAFDDSYKIVNLKNAGFGWVVVDDQVLCADTLGIQGNTNPKDGNGDSPATAYTVPASGAVFQVEAKADGVLMIVHKASSNKQYTVFENKIPVGYHFAMITVDAKGMFGNAGENVVIEYTLEGDNNLNQFTKPYAVMYAEDYLKEQINPNDTTIGKKDYAQNGLGVISVNCYAGCTYYFNACGSKMSALGVAYFPVDKDVYVRNEDATIGDVKIYTAAPAPEGIENASANAVKATKVIENGQVVIIRGDVRYNALGTVME